MILFSITEALARRRFLRIILTRCAALIACLLAITAAAQDGKLPFAGGEKLRYAVRWKLLPAGSAELSVSQDQTFTGRWNVIAKAHSTGYVSNIFKVQDEYRSTFRNPTFCSLGIQKTIHEGERNRDVKINFDTRRKLGRLEERDLSGNEAPKSEQFAIPDCVHDILSSLYYARSLPLKVGQSFEFPLNDGGKTIQIHADVQAEEEVETPVGTFRALRIEPDLFSGHLFGEKGRIFIWISNDAQKIPLQLRAQIDAGTITATLAGIEKIEAGR